MTNFIKIRVFDLFERQGEIQADKNIDTFLRLTCTYYRSRNGEALGELLGLVKINKLG
jgi:hypothetical protein